VVLVTGFQSGMIKVDRPLQVRWQNSFFIFDSCPNFSNTFLLL